jgi:YidC/Oxa1 family membrane protein insertase
MHPNSPAGAPDMRNLLLAIVLATAIMIGWQYFYEAPRQKAAQAAAAIAQANAPKAQSPKAEVKIAAAIEEVPAPTIAIKTDRLHGSISLRGARFDDLTLAQYRESLDDNALEVKLLAKQTAERPYFIETGMLPADSSVRVPDSSTIWRADKTTLTSAQPVTLTWDNGAGLKFEKKITVDDAYLFTITTTVINNATAPVTLYPYGLISRHSGDALETSDFLSDLLIHPDGPIAVINDILQDSATYGALHADGAQKFEAGTGWIGFTDKFWLTALIPTNGEKFDASFAHVGASDSKLYQSDLRGQPLVVPAQERVTHAVKLFAGAKEVNLLDAYAAQHSIPLLDRAVNFGSLYFLAKPIFQLLSYFNSLIGNFGVAIILLTCVIKLLLFPLAHKSMTAMSHMKRLTPHMQELRERHTDDKMKLNQEIMALYKREKVNPAAGCLPLLLQIPVFLALFRVLSVTIEMRQAPFFGWIHDLSIADPSNIFTLFGLIDWAPPGILHLGVWPILMCATMVVQQHFNPKPADEVQAMMMKYMPYFFLIIFAKLPAGLVIYSVVNNILTIIQQLVINMNLKKKGLH